MGKKLLVLLAVGIVIAGCKKNLTPLDDNHRTLEDIYPDAGYAEGILMNAYTRLPTNSYSFSAVLALIAFRIRPEIRCLANLPNTSL